MTVQARADDPIWRVPFQFDGVTLYVGPDIRFHLCASATLINDTSTRGSLDPMAIGKCRHCGEALPA